jgi:cyclopropane fatty-acyl-phospholipid synthase-like methyltransferase
MNKTLLIPQKTKITSENTAAEIIDCYGGQKWVKEVNELFPESEFGCINYGYWDQISTPISLEEREQSQLNLYLKLFEFAELKTKSIPCVLEMGCGRGHGVHLLNQKGCIAYGIDMVDAQIQKCINHYPELKNHYKQAFVNNTGFKANVFDFVISVEAAQHFHSFFSFTRESYRVLKNKGKIAITTFFFPNEKSKIKIKNFIPPDISGTHRAISIQQAKNHLKKAGFENIEVIPIGAKVFEGFSRWAAQAMTNTNHTPKWLDAYENNLIEYYMLTGEKIKKNKRYPLN